MVISIGAKNNSGRAANSYFSPLKSSFLSVAIRKFFNCFFTLLYVESTPWITSNASG